MAWINESSQFTWDVEYSSQKDAANKALKLAEQYKVFVDTARTEEGKYVAFTKNTITEEHSMACRCSQCW